MYGSGRGLGKPTAGMRQGGSFLLYEAILPSEKAFAYKMRLDAMKRQAGRPAQDNYSPVGNNSFAQTSSAEMADAVGESKNQIYRFIRLTALIPPLLQMVDDGKIAFRPAVELQGLGYSVQDIQHIRASLRWHRQFSMDIEDILLAEGITGKLLLALQPFDLLNLPLTTAQLGYLLRWQKDIAGRYGDKELFCVTGGRVYYCTTCKGVFYHYHHHTHLHFLFHIHLHYHVPVASILKHVLYRKQPRRAARPRLFADIHGRTFRHCGQACP